MEWKREIVWTDGAMQHTSHQAVFQWINRNQISRWIALHRFCARLPLGRERKGIGGWRGKEGTRRGDYRRHCSLCERLSLARQGGGTLWILMNWQDSPPTPAPSPSHEDNMREKEEVIRKIQPLHGKANRAGHFPCDNYSYNHAWGIGNGPAYSSCPAKATTVPVKEKSMMMWGFFCCRWGDSGKSRSACLERAAGELGLWGRS